MFLEGRVWRDPDDAKMWLIEIPILNLMAQGKSKKDAFKMIKNVTSELIRDLPTDVSKGYVLKTEEFEEGKFGLTCSIPIILIAIIVRRQREGAGLRQKRTKADAVLPMYTDNIETGRSACSILKFVEILEFLNPKQKLVLRIG